MIGPLHGIYRAATWIAVITTVVAAATIWGHAHAHHARWPHGFIWLIGIDAAALFTRRITGRMCSSAIGQQLDYRRVRDVAASSSDRQHKQLTSIYRKWK